MATTFDVNRIGGGTFELVQDPTTGRYTIKEVGFTPVKKLTLPDYTTAGSTAGTTDTSKATTTATEETIKQQTTEAFKPAGGGEAIDYTGGEMLSQAQLQKEAKKIDPQVDTSTTTLGIARPTMRDIAGDTTEQQKDTTPFKRPTMRDVAGETLPSVRKAPGIFVDKDTIKPFGTFDVTPKGVFSRPEYTSTTPTAKAAMTSDAAQLGISKVESTAIPSATRTAKEADFASGVYKSDTDAIMRGATGVKYEEPTLSVQANTALKKVSTGLKALGDAVGEVLSSGPLISLVKAVAKPETITQKHDKQYFTDRGDGRIGGNPATDLYAGMNRVSAFGNLEAAGDKRIETREATAAKKGYTKDNDPTGFVAKTEKMKEQQSDYKQSVRSSANNVPPSQRGGGGGGSGSGGGRVICTELNKTDELSTQDLVRDIRFTYRHLTKKHLKGYLAWAIPTVRHIQKFKTYRKVWKHIAQHRANDIAWRMNQGKFDLLGRIYAGIGEPLCWIIGNFVSDKNYDLFNNKRNRHL